MVDARAGIQAALDAAGDRGMVQLGCGRWLVSRAPERPATGSPRSTLHGRHVTLAGSGPCTVLAATGDAGKGDWYVVDVHDAEDVTIRDLTIDTSGLTNTEEQTHAIQVIGPVDGVRIERVTFDHPRRDQGPRRRLPPPARQRARKLVQHVSVVDATFAVCARSAIGVQRGVFGLQVVGSRFLDILKTPIDYEPTSAGGNGALIPDRQPLRRHQRPSHPGGAGGHGRRLRRSRSPG